jgi:hypothetical protein
VVRFRSGLFLPRHSDGVPPPADKPKRDGEDILRPVEAIGVYRQLITDERVRLAPEPQNVESAWISLMSIRAASGSTWTDAYLAAFAMDAEFPLITFDRGMGRWPGLALELLTPAWWNRAGVVIRFSRAVA